jgi:hypothetical protein
VVEDAKGRVLEAVLHPPSDRTAVIGSVPAPAKGRASARLWTHARVDRRVGAEPGRVLRIRADVAGAVDTATTAYRTHRRASTTGWVGGTSLLGLSAYAILSASASASEARVATTRDAYDRAQADVDAGVRWSVGLSAGGLMAVGWGAYEAWRGRRVVPVVREPTFIDEESP